MTQPPLRLQAAGSPPPANAAARLNLTAPHHGSAGPLALGMALALALAAWASPTWAAPAQAASITPGLGTLGEWIARLFGGL